MKLTPTPTSPKKLRPKKDIEKLYKEGDLKSIKQPRRKWRSSIISVLIFAVIFGFLGGILGELVLSTYLLSRPGLIEQIYIGKNSGTPIIYSNNKNKDDLELQQIIGQTATSLVKIYQKSDQDFLDNESSLGDGVMLTSDGLAATSFKLLDDDKNNYLITTADRKTYNIDQIYQDPISDLTFFKIEASGLSVVELANRRDISLGEQLIVIQNQVDSAISHVSIVNVLATHWLKKNDNLLNSSETYNDYLKIDTQLENFTASAVINKLGRLVGLVQSDQNSTDLLIGSDLIDSALTSILDNQRIIRNNLGVNYIDLSQVVGTNSEISYGLKYGALIKGDELTGQLGIEPDSPADIAGIEWGDIIIELSNNQIDQNNLLSTLIQDYKNGDPLEIEILRDGKELTLNITLEELKDQ